MPLDVPEGFYAHIDDTDDTKTVVVIEELKHQGYTMIDKHAGADAHHVKLALTSLANYHALTIALLRKHLAPDGKQFCIHLERNLWLNHLVLKATR